MPAAAGNAALAWLREHRGEIAVVAALTALAAVPRLVFLTDIPPGLHGDEAWTGIRADVILRDGWIGGYDGGHGAGQPAGGEYWTAALVWLFGNSMFMLRLAMALVAIGTFPVAYVFCRQAGGRTVAVIATVLLGFNEWHLHYSRIAMPTVTLPFFEVLSSLLIILALRRRSWWLFGLAGAVLGLGIYSYGSYPFFPVAAGFFVVFWLLTNRREWRRTLVLQLALLAAVALLAAAPMFSYAKANDDEYFRVARSTLLFNSQQYKEANGLTGKADVILDAGRDYVRYAVFDSYFDYVDASGTAPMLDPVTAVALGLGVLLALRRWRTPAVALALAAFFVLPWAGILTEAAAFRRTLGVTPYVALLAALPLAALWDGARKRARWQAAAAGLIVVCALAVAAFLNLNHYFGSFADHAHSRWVFAADLTEASEFMNELPPATYVYFYSERWSFDYETRRYLAPDRLGEDRSEEFSESGTLSLTPEGDADVAYVFLSPYLDHADLVESGYPGGTRFAHVGDGGLVAFVAYLLPASEFPAEPIEGPQERDRTRVANLAAIQRVLESYRDDTGLYIRTHGEIQTLCVSQRADLGCALRDYLDPLPQDPLGDPAANGYWYASDGETYALYAQRESEALPPCEEHPSYLLQFASLLCVLGP